MDKNIFSPEIEKAVQNCTELSKLEQLRLRYLGRKGVVTVALRELKDVSPQERKERGPKIQNLKKLLTALIETKKQELLRQSQLPKIDVTAPPLKQRPFGHLHPVTQFEHRIWQIFQRYNFDIYQTPEIETDFFNFQALNIPPHHPARDMQDTFYLNQVGEIHEPLLLRTHTTAMQGRYIRDHRPPIRVIATGKCFRRDADLTHTPMFHQFDGLWVDERVTMGDLKGLLESAMSQLLEQKVTTRFRVSYFSFVEPGAEFDIRCTLCQGQGCGTCKKTGWLEMGGCGVVHPKVLKNFGLDPAKFQGIAWGFGIERPFMIRYRVHDLRLFFENDQRFLHQFPNT